MAENSSNGHVATSNMDDLHQMGHNDTDPRCGVITGQMDEWEAIQRRKKQFYDAGNLSFFWRAHRVLALIIFSGALWCLAMYTETSEDSVYNTKRALIACIVVLCVLGVTHLPDGPFRRPHPAFWKLLLALSIIYEVFLVFILFQKASDARQLLTHIDPSLGVPLVERNYGGNCKIYDANNTEDPWHNMWDKMDTFVAVHFFGWFFKTLVLRDYWMCMVISIMFEFLEYTFEHQLPNFSECWWDHWIMDAIICNGAGMYLGMKALDYLSIKTYFWRSAWEITTYRGKFSRIIKQFTPYFWTEFDWRPTQSLTRWLAMLFLIFMFLLAELNTFYLKFTLWVPDTHPLILVRLVFLLLWGAVTTREHFQFMEDSKFTKMGTQFWMNCAITITELMITMKFDWETVTKPLPSHISLFWIAGISVLIAWTIWNFYLHRVFLHLERKLQTLRAMRKRKGLCQCEDRIHTAMQEYISSESDLDDSFRSNADSDSMHKKIE